MFLSPLPQYQVLNHTFKERSRRSMKTTNSIVVSLAFLTLLAAGCNKQEQKDPRTQPDLVQLITVSSPSGSSQSFTGVVTARVQSDLGFRVSGKVVQRLVDVGQNVSAGQPLMRIDITDYTHAITAQAENVNAAQARADQAAADEARYRGLVITGAVSASNYDQVKAAADAALAQLAAAKAQEKIARNQGDYSLLLADAQGTVVETMAEPGQVVAAGQTVVKLAHAGPREAAVYLPETNRPALGSVAHAALYGGTESIPARLRQLSDSADPETRTFEARYVLAGAEARAPLGSTVTIQLLQAGTPDSTPVPNAAITDRGNGPAVWVFHRDTSTVSLRPVSILRLGQENAYLASGVRQGEEVVALGAHLLTDGEHVRVAETEAATR
jgi:RND family efflux transporter MFP subunit